MTRTLSRRAVKLGTLVCLLTGATMSLPAQSQRKVGEWPTYGGDLASTRYSPLDQINASNFNKLEVAWRFKTDNLGPRPEYNLESTPLVVNGMLYSVAGSRRAVVALNAATGELKWVYSYDEGRRGVAVPRPLSGRGLAYWTDGKEERIVYVTPGYQMIALDAKIGRPIANFGRNGIVDLKQDNDQVIEPESPLIGYASAPVITKDVVIVGSAGFGGAQKSKTAPKGYVRGFDVRTGKRLWIFHTIPSPGEYGNETWEKDSWSYTGQAGVWAQMTVDEELGLVYMGVETPTGDYYGGHRPGANLFAESLVAVDIKTGKRKWHYQLVHHGLWDVDIPCAPILVEAVAPDGRVVKAVAQPTKQSWLYVLNRETGEPIWPIEERPVPKGDIPGEWYSPTQPFPTKPPAYGRQGAEIDDLIDFTPELRAEALKVIAKYKYGPVFTPPVVSKVEGPLGLLTAMKSGTIWAGGSYDPENRMVYVYSGGGIGSIGLVPPNDKEYDIDYAWGSPFTGPTPERPEGVGNGEQLPPPAAPAGTPARPAAPAGGGGGGTSVQGLPLGKPPYGRIAAINLNTGDIAWTIAHGDTPDNVRNHPALKGLTIPRTGRAGQVGILTTKTLVIAGESGYATTNGRRGAKLRAYDKATGKDAGEVFLPAPQSGSPMTYMIDGRQYIVLAISGGAYTGELVAFRLPNN
jgi:quinoprotein glucose dehydrogenase